MAGWLQVDPAERAAYLAAVDGVARLARTQPGCREFVQVADPLEPDRVVVHERWDDDASLAAFRALPGDETAVVPQVRGAQVQRYRISSVEDA